MHQSPHRGRGVVIFVLLAALAAPLPAAAAEPDGGPVDYLALAARLLSDANYTRAAAALRQVDPAREGVDAARYFTLKGLVALRRGDAASAVDALKRALARRERNFAADRTQAELRALRFNHLYLAQAHFRLEHYRQTITHLDAAGAVARGIAAAHALRAQAYWQLAQPVAAFAALNHGAKLFPKDPRFLRRKVFYLIDLGFYRQATELGHRYLRQAEATPSDYLAIGEALRENGQYRAALDILERARLVYPHHRKIAVALAHVYLDQGRVALAADILAQAAAVHRDLLAEAAELQRRAGHPWRALFYNARIANQQQKLRQRLSILIAMKQWTRAAAMGEALRRQGLLERADLRYAFAYALFKTGDYAAAEKVLAGLTGEDALRKANQLRQAIAECRRAEWRCL